MKKRILCIISFIALILSLTSCAGSQKPVYYNDPNPTTLTSKYLVDGEASLKSPDEYFTVKLKLLTDLDQYNGRVRIYFIADPNLVVSNTYTLCTDMTGFSYNNKAPKLYVEDINKTMLFTRNQYEKDFSVKIAIESDDAIKDYQYYLQFTFCNDTYKFRLF